MKHKALTLKHLREWNKQLEASQSDFNFNLNSFRCIRSDCKTSYCAVGYLTMVLEFQTLGLTLSNAGYIFYKGEYDESALAKFFDLDENIIRYIFYPEDDPVLDNPINRPQPPSRCYR